MESSGTHPNPHDTATGHDDSRRNTQPDEKLEGVVSAESASAKQGVLPRNDDEIDLDLEDDEIADATPHKHNAVQTSNHSQMPNLSKKEDFVPESVRAQLPASFAKPPPPSSPPDITNKTTQFLALDKCLPHRKFLQILSIDPTNQSATTSAPISDSPYQLSYDKEWLAITRVFASDLKLGEPSSPIPPNKGHAFYLPLIDAEERWVEENLEKKGLMMIPENFEITAPIYDPAVGMGS